MEAVSRVPERQVIFVQQGTSTARQAKSPTRLSMHQISIQVHLPRTKMTRRQRSKSIFLLLSPQRHLLPPLSQIARLFMYIILDLQNISISQTSTIPPLVLKHSSTRKRHLPLPIPTNALPQHNSPKQRSTQHPSNPQPSSPHSNNPSNNQSPSPTLPTFHTITQHTQP